RGRTRLPDDSIPQLPDGGGADRVAVATLDRPAFDAGAMDRARRQSLDGASAGQSALAASFRQSHRSDRGRFWRARRAADASGTARLAGDGLRRPLTPTPLP